ncbi:MAG: hypothetical protein HY913_19355 [Desulfomonile tiedjei]|nr:hypothetical protein [Desulfomonile tiedjei]
MTLREITSQAMQVVEVSLSILDQWAKTSKFAYPVFLSLVAAFIFWVTFSYLPERERRRKLRPVVELALFETYTNLFYVFDAIMGHHNNSPSDYQSEIRSGQLCEDAIAMGLANKCLNASYFYDHRIRGSLLVIGPEVLERSQSIDELANKIISLHTYATAKEIILIERIREKLREYDFDSGSVNASAEVVINGISYFPVNPTISYRKRNLCQLYKLFCELQQIVLNRRRMDRDQFIYKIQHLFHAKRYKSCKKFIGKHGPKFSKDSTVYNGYLALCERGLGNTKKFYEIIKSVYKLRPYGGALVSSRDMFKDCIDDKKLVEILAAYHSKQEVAAFQESVREDGERKLSFERTNKALVEYYRSKAESARAGGNTA